MDNPFRPAEHYSGRIVAVTAVFSFIAIALLAVLDRYVDNQWIVASFGSSAVLIYAAPKAPFSKPKNVFFGHVFSAIVSLVVVVLFDSMGIYTDLRWMVCGLCVMLAILVMIYTGTIHPPAGATALTIGLNGTTDPMFLVFPLMIGLLIMMAVAYAANILKQPKQ